MNNKSPEAQGLKGFIYQKYKPVILAKVLNIFCRSLVFYLTVVLLVVDQFYDVAG